MLRALSIHAPTRALTHELSHTLYFFVGAGNKAKKPEAKKADDDDDDEEEVKKVEVKVVTGFTFDFETKPGAAKKTGGILVHISGSESVCAHGREGESEGGQGREGETESA